MFARNDALFDAVVPQSLTSRGVLAAHPGGSMQAGGLFDTPPVNLSDMGKATLELEGLPAFPTAHTHAVPQVPSFTTTRKALTSAQQSELEMARRRAQKALEGKRANAAAKRTSRVLKESDDDLDDEADNEKDLDTKPAKTGDEKEAKRLKRLLRNRVSAQQARERKKSYVTNLEDKAKQQEQEIVQLEQRLKTLERENMMLRQVMKNMQGAANAESMSVPTLLSAGAGADGNTATLRTLDP